jgi:hypothetical protein
VRFARLIQRLVATQRGTGSQGRAAQLWLMGTPERRSS